MVRASDKRAIVVIVSVSVVVFALTGCAARSEVETSTPASTETSAVAHGSAADFVPDLPGVPLSEALAQVGHDVSLPPTEAAGGVEKVALDPTAPGDDGRPGMIVVFESGIRLFVNGREYDMTDLGSGAAPFSDGRTSAFEPRKIGDRQVLICPVGEQLGREGKIVNTVPASIIWNERGMGYRLVAASTDVNMEDLLAVLGSFD